LSYLDPDAAVLIIVAWTLVRDFFLAPILVRRELERHAVELVEQLFVGLALILRDPAKKAALEGILGELAPAIKGAALKGMKPPSIKEMFMMGIGMKMGLIPREMLGGPAQGAPEGPDSGPASGPDLTRKVPFWRR